MARGVMVCGGTSIRMFNIYMIVMYIMCTYMCEVGGVVTSRRAWRVGSGGGG